MLENYNCACLCTISPFYPFIYPQLSPILGKACNCIYTVHTFERTCRIRNNTMYWELVTSLQCSYQQHTCDVSQCMHALCILQHVIASPTTSPSRSRGGHSPSVNPNSSAVSNSTMQPYMVEEGELLQPVRPHTWHLHPSAQPQG